MTLVVEDGFEAFDREDLAEEFPSGTKSSSKKESKSQVIKNYQLFR